MISYDFFENFLWTFIIDFKYLGISFGLTYIGTKSMDQPSKLKEISSKIYDLSKVADNTTCTSGSLSQSQKTKLFQFFLLENSKNSTTKHTHL